MNIRSILSRLSSNTLILPLTLTISTLTVLQAAPAGADSALAAPVACGSFMLCGSYDGSVANLGTDGQPEGAPFREKIAFTAVDAHTIHVSEALYDASVKPGDGYVLEGDFVFTDDGRYTMMDKGQLFATGVCQNLVCSFDFVPWVQTNKGQTVTVGNVMILRFSATGLERLTFFSQNAGAYGIQKSDLLLIK